MACGSCLHAVIHGSVLQTHERDKMPTVLKNKNIVLENVFKLNTFFQVYLYFFPLQNRSYHSEGFQYSYKNRHDLRDC